MGRSSKDLNKHKPKTNSVKGKKEFARNRALLPTYITAASNKGSVWIELIFAETEN